MSMSVWACVTTRERTQKLDECLGALWSSAVKPEGVVVSDDSPSADTRRRNQEGVRRYPAATYLTGPRAGVCANRNNAIDAVPRSDRTLVAFIDDDVRVDPDFFAVGVKRYAEMAESERGRTILTGIIRSVEGQENPPGRLTF